MEPKTKHKYVGIEIECLSRLTRDQITAKIIEHDLQDILEATNDRSVVCTCPRKTKQVTRYNIWSGRDETTTETIKTCSCLDFEFRILSKEDELRVNLDRINVFIHDIRAWVNNSCGLHVHLDMRYREYERIAHKFYNVQNIIMSAINKNRTSGPHADKYCAKLKNRLEMFKYDQGNKYKAINVGPSYMKHKTIEIRAHEGTLDADEIYNWCTFLLEVINTTIRKPTKRTSIFSHRVKTYLDNRIKQQQEELEVEYID